MLFVRNSYNIKCLSFSNSFSTWYVTSQKGNNEVCHYLPFPEKALPSLLFTTINKYLFSLASSEHVAIKQSTFRVLNKLFSC